MGEPGFATSCVGLAFLLALFDYRADCSGQLGNVRTAAVWNGSVNRLMFTFLTDPDWVKVAVIWIGALCTIGIYSILYKENRLFRLFEHLFIGLATGYTLYTAWNDVLGPLWWKPMIQQGQWWWAFALPGGLLFYAVYSQRHGWLARLVFGIFFGVAAGQAFQGYAAYYFPLAVSAMKVPLVNPPEASAPGAYGLTPFSAVLNNLLYLAIVIA